MIDLSATYLFAGCELSSAQTTVVFKAEDDLLENQFFIKTVKSLFHQQSLAAAPVTIVIHINNFSQF